MPVQCLGSCDTAPVVQINEDYFEKLNPEKFREIIRKLKDGVQVQPGRQT
jgi:NADH:ubiquinone oxidoreductase subunit E